MPASNLSDYKAVRGMAILYFKGLSAIYCYEICHIRAFLRHFWGKTQKVLSKKAFFRFKVWGFQSFFVTSPSMRKKLRPDVASDTSRRNNGYVPTYSLLHPDAVSKTFCLLSSKFLIRHDVI